MCTVVTDSCNKGLVDTETTCLLTHVALFGEKENSICTYPVCINLLITAKT